jgi:hypothetical protein
MINHNRVMRRHRHHIIRKNSSLKAITKVHNNFRDKSKDIMQNQIHAEAEQPLERLAGL